MRLSTLKLFTGLVFILFLQGTGAVAQTSTLSPYSRFGIGDLLFRGYAAQRGMAGTSIAAASATKLNFNNPATYAFDTLMVLDFGLDAEILSLKQGDFSSTQLTSSISNFSIGFPLKRNKWGLAFGFIPYSGTGYNIESSETLDSSNVATSRFVGEGGYTRYYIGTGLKVTENFSVGVNASYLFGTVTRTRRVEFSNTNFFNNRYGDELNIADFYLEFGLHYNGKLNEKYNYSIGLTGSPAQDVTAKKSILWENYVTTFSGIEAVRDTVSYTPDKKGKVTLPTKIGFGFQINQPNKMAVGLDFNWQDWSNFKSFGISDSLKSSFRISTGAQWTPDYKGIRYIDRIQYRGGFYFNKTYLELRNTSLNDMGLTIGFGMPFRRSFGSMLNFAVEAGSRGTKSNNLIKEQYLRFSFGLTLNEDWFRKSRYD